jgi:hypothetical protein
MTRLERLTATGKSIERNRHRRSTVRGTRRVRAGRYLFCPVTELGPERELQRHREQERMGLRDLQAVFRPRDAALASTDAGRW